MLAVIADSKFSTQRSGVRLGKVAAAIVLVAMASSASAADCGIVRMYDENNHRQDIYPIGLIAIDGNTQFRNGYERTMPVGSHTLELGEKIPPSELSHGVARHRDRSIRKRDLTIDVQPNTLYVIGAKLVKEHRDDPKAYWAPIVLRDEGHPCNRK